MKTLIPGSVAVPIPTAPPTATEPVWLITTSAPGGLVVAAELVGSVDLDDRLVRATWFTDRLNGWTVRAQPVPI